jgi:hypothetical protein
MDMERVMTEWSSSLLLSASTSELEVVGVLSADTTLSACDEGPNNQNCISALTFTVEVFSASK